MAPVSTAEGFFSLDSVDALSAGALGFMPRILVLTTFPHRLQRSPLAIDLYVWLSYRMSYLRRPTVIPWESLHTQFGANYSRPRDFRRRASTHLIEVIRVYPAVRVGATDSGLRLYPSPPHVAQRVLAREW